MPTIHNTLGILFDATVVSSMLYGVGCLQAWHYFRNHSKRDTRLLRCLVAFVILCDTAQQATLTVYTYIITNFGNPDILSHLVNTLVIELFFENFIALAVQLEQWELAHQRIFGKDTTSTFSPTCLIPPTGNVYGIKVVQLSTIAELAPVKTLSMSCNIATAVTDVLITSTLIYYLASAKNGLKNTDDMLNRLIAFTFNTGIPTSLCGVAACIAINTSPDTFIYMFWFLMFGRLYTNSLLVTLNTRTYIRNLGTGINTFPLAAPSNYRFNDRSPQQNTEGTIEIQINSSTTREESDDQTRNHSPVLGDVKKSPD
ncbi:hypothetical protein C8R43DRAFT_1125111 [Mycena crocata]|nr:hypothetical protein C8R43DRAFT_1125111 [Mycena crocata]